MTIEQLGKLIQGVVPDLVKMGNAFAHLEKQPKNFGEDAIDMADDLEKIAHELRAYLSPDFGVPTPVCPTCGETATHRITDGQWFCSNAHGWRTEPPRHA